MTSIEITEPAFLADALRTPAGRVLVTVTPSGWSLRRLGVVLASGAETGHTGRRKALEALARAPLRG